jgi:hypothetical protein
VGSYHINFTRDTSHPGFEKDLQIAIQLQSLRAQQQQADAASDAAFAAMLKQFSTPLNFNNNIRVFRILVETPWVKQSAVLVDFQEEVNNVPVPIGHSL